MPINSVRRRRHGRFGERSYTPAFAVASTVFITGTVPAHASLAFPAAFSLFVAPLMSGDHPFSPDALLGAALARLRVGDSAGSERLCLALLAWDPARADGFSALALARRARFGAAVERLFDRALAIRPDYPEALANRATLRMFANHADGALADVAAALRLNPALASVHGLRAHLLFAGGEHAAAAAAAARALALGPARDDLRFIHVDGLRRAACWADAETAAREALRAAPTAAGLWVLLGLIRHARGRRAEAVEATSRALVLEPAGVAAFVNRAYSLTRLRRRAEAVATFHRALVIAPGNPEAVFGLANALIDLNRWREARPLLMAVPVGGMVGASDMAHSWSRVGLSAQRSGDVAVAVEALNLAVRLEPETLSHHAQRAAALVASGRHGEADAAFRRALALAPGDGGVAVNYATALVTEGRVDEAVALLGWTYPFQADPHKGHSNRLFARQYQPGIDPARHRAEHRAWRDQHAAGLVREAPVFANPPDPDRPLRVGLVSADLGRHPVGYFLSPFLEAHDRRNFAVVCYSSREREDAMSVALKRHVAQWRRVQNLSDDELAAMVRADGIDILIDLSGHTAGNRLLAFARRPAPVQLTWLGYVNTTGMPEIDGFIGGGLETPLNAEAGFEERVLLRLPDGRFCYRPPGDAPSVVPPPSTRRAGITFGSFNSLAKLSAPTVALWARVLEAVPGSRLLLKARPLGDEVVRWRIGAAFAAVGVGGDRLELRPWTPHGDMLAEYGDLDVALDPTPFGGGLTSCEALWMGAPVVTWPRDGLAGRQTAGFLDLLGLSDLIADGPDAYVAIAAALAQDPGRLAALRAGMRERMRASPLMDGPRFARALEAALRDMWRAWSRASGGKGA
jgi:predicted O-linked N-acetylglucosamine transferase (SPINDLY family)